jgi:molybdopterin molybdotransferase
MDPPGRLDPHRCGCDTEGGLLPVDDALAIGLSMCCPVAGTDVLPLSQAAGRVLAADLFSLVDLPPFDCAAMDGWALCRDDLAGPGPEWTLPVAGAAHAGHAAPPLAPGTACRILTGAPLPSGADTVVASEDARADAGVLRLARRPEAGAHVRRAGGDLAAGARLLSAGRVIGAAEAAALAAAGQSMVTVRRRLRVAVVTTGSELVPPGQALGPGQIWNVNRALLTAALDCPWIKLLDDAPVADDRVALTAALADAAHRADVVLTTGGVAAGDADHTQAALRCAGGEVRVAGVAMKPGKPLALGRVGGALWVGLPGNPVAAFVGWTVIAAPLARALAGITQAAPRKVVARLAAAVAHRPGRCAWLPARLTGYGGDGALVVECLPDAGSHRVAQLAQAGGLALIPASSSGLRPGDLVEFMPF